MIKIPLRDPPAGGDSEQSFGEETIGVDSGLVQSLMSREEGSNEQTTERAATGDEWEGLSEAPETNRKGSIPPIAPSRAGLIDIGREARLISYLEGRKEDGGLTWGTNRPFVFNPDESFIFTKDPSCERIELVLAPNVIGLGTKMRSGEVVENGSRVYSDALTFWVSTTESFDCRRHSKT